MINVKCVDNQSFKYSILLYLYSYNIKTNRTRVAQLNNNIKPYLHIKFNNNNTMCKSEKDSKNIDLLIINKNSKPAFLSRNNAPIKVIIVKMNDRYGIIKPTLQRFKDNINERSKIKSNIIKKYKLTDGIKKELLLDPDIFQKM